MVVNTALFGTHINTFPYFLAGPLLELPWKVMSPPVELQILISLETFPANFTQESVGGHEGLWR